MIRQLKNLQNNQGFIKYFKNTSWLFSEKILRMFVGLFVGIWIARYLGPEKFGLFSYAQSFVGLFTIIATLGLHSIVVRELVNNKYDANKLIGTAFIMMLIASFFVILLLVVAVIFSSNDTFTNILIFFIASATILQPFNVIDFYFQSKVLSKYIVFANVFTLFISSLFKIVLILNNASLEYFAIAVLFDSIVLAIGFIYFYKVDNQNLKNWEFDKVIAKKLLKDSSPLVISAAINSIYMKIDQVMIKEIIGVTEVGYYSAAVKLSEVWYSLGVILCNSLFPAIINAKKISKELYYKRIESLFLFLVIISYSVSITVYFLSDSIILSLYGKEFLEASIVLSIHVFSSIFVYLGVSSGRWHIAEGWSTFGLYRNIFGLLINLILNYLWIKQYGIIGAAYASLVSYIGAFYIFDLIFKKSRYIFLLKTKSLFLLGIINLLRKRLNLKN